ncbi:MAG: hypothetical protein NXI21_03765 [Alphaproteobacteria bacterium]|nr:hypothetical protein [Alphaproteobacteria bacterium]
MTLSEATWARLQAQAEPLVDTIETVINRALDALEAAGDPAAGPFAAGAAAQEPAVFDPDSPPDLTFTRLRSAVLNGEGVHPLQWNRLLRAAIAGGAAKGLGASRLRDLLPLNAQPGRHSAQGYKWVPEAELSFQGQDANGAWRGIRALARRLDLSVEVVFEWRDNAPAGRAGRIGRLRIG